MRGHSLTAFGVAPPQLAQAAYGSCPVVPSSFVCSCSCFTVPGTRVCLNPRSVCRRCLCSCLVFVLVGVGVSHWGQLSHTCLRSVLVSRCMLHCVNTNKNHGPEGTPSGGQGGYSRVHLVNTPLPRELAYFSLSYLRHFGSRFKTENVFPPTLTCKWGFAGPGIHLAEPQVFTLSLPQSFHSVRL